MKKKIAAYALITILTLSLTACAGKKETHQKENNTTQESGTEDNSDLIEPDEKGDISELEKDSSESKAEEESKEKENAASNTEVKNDDLAKNEENTGIIQVSSKTELKNNKKTEDKKSSTKKPSTKKPSTKKPSTKKPSTKKPSTSKPSTNKPGTAKPGTTKPGTEKPGTTKPGTSKPEKITLSSIQSAVKKAYGDNYLPNMAYDKNSIEEVFGVKSDWYTNAIAEGPMISSHVDTFIAVEAKKDNAQDVVEALENYKDYLVNESLQYPMNVPKVNAAKILKVDHYVFFIMLGGYSDKEGDTDGGTEDELLKDAQAQNEIAVKAIKKALSK